MNCVACGRKPSAGELIKCNGCKAGYHYTCANITTAAFTEGQVHLRRTFKCVSCSNVTQRVRVTDDTPVRGVSTPTTSQREMNQYPEGIASNEESLTSDQIEEKVNSMILAKLSLFESNIMKEIRDTVATLVLENSKLRQELKEANMKCISYEHRMKTMEHETSVPTMQSATSDVPPPPCGTCMRLNSNVRAPGSVTAAAASPAHAASLPPEPTLALAPETARPVQTTYAAMARKTADSKDYDSDWVKVRSKRRNNSTIKR